MATINHQPRLHTSISGPCQNISLLAARARPLRTQHCGPYSPSDFVCQDSRHLRHGTTAACCQQKRARPTRALSSDTLEVRAAQDAEETPVQSSAQPEQGPAGDAGQPLLSDIKVVIMSPKFATNVGAIARLCTNFEAYDLWVVAPRCPLHTTEAYRIAVGSRIMDSFKVVDTLQEALADTTGSIGFSRRDGRARLAHPSLKRLLAQYPNCLPLHPPTAGSSHASTSQQQQQQQHSQGVTSDGDTSDVSIGNGAETSHEPDARSIDSSRQHREPASTSSSRKGSRASSTRLALVFGREDFGLSAEEIALCSHACAIPATSGMGSLNLSHAVCVVLAQIFEMRVEAQQAGLTGRQDAPPTSDRFRDLMMVPAASSEVEALIQRWSDLAALVGLGGAGTTGGQGNHARKRTVADHVRSLLLRARATTQEVRVLHGLCSAFLKKLRPEQP